MKSQNSHSYQYDGHDRLSKILFPDKVTPNTSSTTDYEQYDYDNNDNLVVTRKRNAQVVINNYDDLNRVTSRNYPNPDDNVTLRYDFRDRLTSAYTTGHGLGYLRDNAGRLASVYLNGTRSLAYQYDAAGNRTRITWPEATPFYVTTAYDALNRPTSIKELGATPLATYAYDDLSRRTTVTLGNSTTTTYTYTTQSALLTLSHNLVGTVQDNTWTYGRNQAQEITSHAWSNDAYQWTGYVNGTKAYTANGLNQYTAAAGAALGYDGNGNLSSYSVWTYGYDADNRLRTVSKPGLAATLAYDGNGRMHRTTIAGVTTNLLYDGTDLVAEYDSGNALLRRYVHGPGIDEPLVWYEGSGTAGKTWLYADHQNSIVATANGAGTSTATYAYNPYGETNVVTGVRFRYTGQQLLSQLGMYNYKARIYWPALGRFLQTDPVGYGSDMNLYAYVGNDPVNGIDSNGDIPLFFALPGIGGAINAVFEGYLASQGGGSAYEIAAAAGKGFISGYAGTAAGLITRNAAISGAISGGVENAIKSGLNAMAPDPARFVQDTLSGGGAGKIAAKIIPTRVTPVELVAPRGPSSGSSIPQISQSVATTLGQAAAPALTKRK